MNIRSLALVLGLLALAPATAQQSRAEAQKAGSVVTLDGRAEVVVPQGVVAFLGPEARSQSEARGQAAESDLALFGTDLAPSDPIVVTVRWVPGTFAKVEDAPTPDEARETLNRDIAQSRPRIGSAGVATQFSEWIEQPTLSAETRILRQSYSVETERDGRTGTGFTYRATAYGRAGHYEIAVRASADRALLTPAIYNTLVETFHFLPGHTYAEGETDLKNAPPPPAAERNNVKILVFLAALLLVVAIVGGLFWLLVWPRLRDEA